MQITKKAAVVICATAITLTFLFCFVAILYTNIDREKTQAWQATSVYEPNTLEIISHTVHETHSYTRSPTYLSEGEVYYR